MGPTDNQTYSVSGGQSSVDVSNGAKTIQYTVSGVKANEPVEIQLFAPSDVNTSSGQTVFAHSSNPGGTGNVAISHYNGGATITVVNGTAKTGAKMQSATSDSNGTVTFSVVTDSAAGDSYVPVVYDNADADQTLNLGTDNKPTEAFGTGTETSTFKSAPSGNFSGKQVDSANGTSFTDTSGNTYKYAATDVYQLVTPKGTVADTYADFQQRLSEGDSVGGYYNSPNQSTFTLTDVAPEPGAVTAQSSTAKSGGVDLTITPSGSSDVTSYNIYRATATSTSGATGAPTTCPSNPGTPGASPQVAPSTSAAWSKIGSVSADATKTSGKYTYTDATPAPATGTAPSYCYLVSAVGPNAAGSSQEGTGVGPASNTASPAGVTPSKAGVAAGAPAFASSYTDSSTSPATTTNAGATAALATGTTTFTITAPYANGPILCSSVDPLGSDYSAVYTDTNGVNHALTVTGAACNASGTPTTDNVVKITATSTDFSTTAPTGGHIVVTAKNGADKNTVSNNDTTPLYQAVGDALYVPVS